jgi:hypothetical protein
MFHALFHVKSLQILRKTSYVFHSYVSIHGELFRTICGTKLIPWRIQSLLKEKIYAMKFSIFHIPHTELKGHL